MHRLNGMVHCIGHFNLTLYDHPCIAGVGSRGSGKEGSIDQVHHRTYDAAECFENDPVLLVSVVPIHAAHAGRDSTAAQC